MEEEPKDGKVEDEETMEDAVLDTDPTLVEETSLFPRLVAGGLSPPASTLHELPFIELIGGQADTRSITANVFGKEYAEDVNEKAKPQAMARFVRASFVCGCNNDVHLIDSFETSVPPYIIASFFEANGVVGIQRNAPDRAKYLSNITRCLFSEAVDDSWGAWDGKPRTAHHPTENLHLTLTSAHRRDLWPLHFPVMRPGHPSAVLVDRVLSNTAHCMLECRLEGVLFIEPGCMTYGPWRRAAPQLFSIDPETGYESPIGNIPCYHVVVFTVLSACNLEFVGVSFVQTVRAINEQKQCYISGQNMQPGDMIVMDGRTVYRTTPNTSDTPCRIVYSIYAPAWLSASVLH